MPLLNRVTLMKIHMLLAAFIFPVALMFLITGGRQALVFDSNVSIQQQSINGLRRHTISLKPHG